MTHNRYTNSDLVNKKMNEDTYKLRRKVIDLIYEINEIIKLPRINVRITKDHKQILGSASLTKNTNIIWITEKSITLSDYDLRSIVYHEILHTVYGIPHYKNCPLMKPIHKKGMNKSQVQKIFLSYMDQPKKSNDQKRGNPHQSKLVIIIKRMGYEVRVKHNQICVNGFKPMTVNKAREFIKNNEEVV